jgi:hypothetical protein
MKPFNKDSINITLAYPNINFENLNFLLLRGPFQLSIFLRDGFELSALMRNLLNFFRILERHFILKIYSLLDNNINYFKLIFQPLISIMKNWSKLTRNLSTI